MSTSRSLFASPLNRVAALLASAGAVAAIAVGAGHLSGPTAATTSHVRADGGTSIVVVPPTIPIPPVLPGDGGVAGWD